MELLTVLDENGIPTGQGIARTEAHRNGILHGAVHIFIYREHQGVPEALLQRRSPNKDSFPNCLDISSAGHMEFGMDFAQTAVKELEEELGIQADDLKPVFRRRSSNVTMQKGEVFNDQEIAEVYFLRMDDLDVSKLKLQEEEVSEVLWMDLNTVITRLEKGDGELCLDLEEFRQVAQLMTGK